MKKKLVRQANSNAVSRPLKLWQDQSSQQEVRIEIVPLIDVIFCILTFFILAAVNFSRQQAINLDLPSARTGQPQLSEMLVVSLDNSGQVYVEQQYIPPEELAQILKNYYLLNPQGLVVLHASKEARYSNVVEILDLLRTFGGDRVALATLPLDASEPAPSLPSTAPNVPIYPNVPDLP